MMICGILSLSVSTVAAVPAGADDPLMGSGVNSVANRPLPKAPPMTARAAATERAEDSGARVEVEDERDDRTTTYANPDGSFTTDVSSSPVRVNRNGEWVPVDLSLKHVGGNWTPMASPNPVFFSDGGDDPAATIGVAKQRVSLAWDVSLPTPEIHGDEAVYELDSNTKLVLRATVDGFEQSLLLASPPDTLPRQKLPFAMADGLELRSAAGRSFEFVDGDGTVVYTIPTPIMYDSSRNPDTDLPGRTSPVTAEIKRTNGEAVLDLSPSLQWLRDPATQYPVTIDPVVATFGDTADNWVEEGLTTSQDNSPVLRAGMFGTDAARSYIQFGSMAQFSNKKIRSANLNMYFTGGDSCTPARLYAYPIREWRSGTSNSNIVWTNRPNANYSATYAASSLIAHGSNAGAGCPNDWDSIDLVKMVTAWSTGAIPSLGVQLNGDESAGSTRDWTACSRNPASSGSACIYASRVPYISVTYAEPNPPATSSSWSYGQWGALPASPVSVTLSRASGDSGTTPKTLLYSVDGGAQSTVAWTGNAVTATAPSTYGAHWVTAKFVDDRGNESSPVIFSWGYATASVAVTDVAATYSGTSALLRWNYTEPDKAMTDEFDAYLIDETANTRRDLGGCMTSNCRAMSIAGLTVGHTYKAYVTAVGRVGSPAAVASASGPAVGPDGSTTRQLTCDDVADVDCEAAETNFGTTTNEATYADTDDPDRTVSVATASTTYPATEVIDKFNNPLGYQFLVRRGFWNGKKGFAYDKIRHKHQLRGLGNPRFMATSPNVRGVWRHSKAAKSDFLSYEYVYWVKLKDCVYNPCKLVKQLKVSFVYWYFVPNTASRNVKYLGYSFPRNQVVGTQTLYCHNPNKAFACPSWVQRVLDDGYNRTFSTPPPDVPGVRKSRGVDATGTTVESYDTGSNPDGVQPTDADADNQPTRTVSSVGETPDFSVNE